MMQSTDPLFSFTTIQILRNCPHNFHKDAHNKGSSQIFTLGEFEGGEFMYEGKKHDVQYVRNGFKMFPFDGNEEHAACEVTNGTLATL